MLRINVRKSLSAGVAAVFGVVGWLFVLPPTAEATPSFTISRVVTGLTIPWDLTWVGPVMLYDQRGGGIWSKRGSAAPKRVSIALPSLYANSEGGLLGMVADPNAASNHLFYTCQSVMASGKPLDVRVLRWRLTSDTRAVAVGKPVITGLPVNRGRHNGCRLRFGPEGKLFVGTGDAAVTGNSQNRQSLGGKVLRVNANGTIPKDNPFYAQGKQARYVWSYGHRNLQGLAFRPGTRELWSAEHGTDRDDEVNHIVKGSNYGWQANPGYNESPPMTDLRRYPKARSATWKSGKPTVATSGLTFLNSPAWGRWEGAVAVAMLKGQGIKILFLNPTGAYHSATNVAGLGTYGRIRTVQVGPDGALYFTTSNGDGRDVIGKITPTATPPTVPAGRNVASVGVSAVRTGSNLYAFVRTTSNVISFKRSRDDGRTWRSGWTSTGVTSTMAPAVASSANGRVDLLTRDAQGRTTHTWFVNGVRRGQTALGGQLTTATVSSLGDGTLDVFGLSPNGAVYRKHFHQTWSSWQRLSGGGLTSSVGASVNYDTRTTVITARGRTGGIHERTVTATGNGPNWTSRSGLLWSGRALGDRFGGRTMLAVSRGSDGYARWQRGNTVMGLEVNITSDPDIVARPDGSWVMFARTSSGLTFYDARPGQYRPRSLGGIVR